MSLPHKISTLLYAFDPGERVLLLQRFQEPNRGCWSPPGGKLRTEDGESPYACACREAEEELGIRLAPADLHLTGIVSESHDAGLAHWLMFLFEIRPRISSLPPAIHEGRFGFFARDELDGLLLPQTDREFIWPRFWSHRGGYFSAHCRGLSAGGRVWILEESRPVDSSSASRPS